MHEVGSALTLQTVRFLWWIPAFPALGVLFHIFLGNRLGKRAVSVVGPAVVGAAFCVSLFAFFQIWSGPPGLVLQQVLWQWLPVGSLDVPFALRVDALSAVMILVVTGVGFLIHVYSVGYMHDDPSYARYFAYLNLFTVAMLVLVMADNLVLLFVGWEGVGLCSYLLIGFWYDNDANASAGKKAFIVNRVGDAAFLVGIFLLLWNLGPGSHSLSFSEIAGRAPELPPGVVTAVALLLFVGATGKSAQLPLYVWLPDAMAGPTPVSALIHAATMVTAGVYMIARLHGLYELAPLALEVVAIVGALTAVFAATIGLVQTDIKKVLAYSTISQLGYMFLAVGVSAFSAGIFHLVTHAFFKALLFLGAGSVIHGMGGEQDIRKMGGLRSWMPVTYGTFLVGTLAIAGVPGLAGFFSKDMILARAFAHSPALWGLGVLGATLTAFYMFRLFFLVFWGECRADAHTRAHIHESPRSMTVPLLALAVLSVVGGYVGLPDFLAWGDRFGAFLAPVLSAAAHGEHHGELGLELMLMAVSVLAAVVGIGVAYRFYVQVPELPEQVARQFRAVYRLLWNKYYVDELYEAVFVRPVVQLAHALWRQFDVAVIDGAVNGAGDAAEEGGRWLRRWQTGNVQHYALSLLVGALLLVGYFLGRG
ncbi:MAG: NADH-quinone oxidoreductase subunit L [Candidatus Binatia bacterium]|nr:MAG: NADH-quinone oxidoreductase subunit L [Candidatus Binatia bacterium]